MPKFTLKSAKKALRDLGVLPARSGIGAPSPSLPHRIQYLIRVETPQDDANHTVEHPTDNAALAAFQGHVRSCKQGRVRLWRMGEVRKGVLLARPTLLKDATVVEGVGKATPPTRSMCEG